MEEGHQDVRNLYDSLLAAWNKGDASGMAALYAPKGGQVGFDGSIANGRDEIRSHLEPVFANHKVATFVAKVREVRPLGPDGAILRALPG